MHDCEQPAESGNRAISTHVSRESQLSCIVSVERLSTDSCPRKIDVLKTNISLRGKVYELIDSFSNLKFPRKTIRSILLRHKLFIVAIVQH